MLIFIKGDFEMKKLFYIVLVIVVLLVVANFVKNGTPNVAQPEVVAVEEVVATPDAEVVADEVAPVEAVADAIANTEILNDGEVVEEDTAEVVEEANPDSTQSDDETVVKE